MTTHRHKWLICAICKKSFYAHPKSRNCKRPACKEVIRLKNLAYAKKYNETHKKQVRKQRNSIKKWHPKIIYTTIPCLKCHENFKSEGIHNRLCDPCRRENGYIGDEEVYSLSSVQKSAKVGQE